MIKQIFHAATQQLEDVTWATDHNNELIATFPDGRFLKFPPGLTEEELQTLIDDHQGANEGQEVITEEVLAAQEAEKAAADDLVNQLNGNTIPEGDKINAPTVAEPGPETA